MRSYGTDLTDEQWALVVSLIPEAKPGGRPRSIDVRVVVNAIFYLLRTGCQWRLLPHDFPPWPTVYYYFRRWEEEAVWLSMMRTLYPLVRRKAGRREAPSVAMMSFGANRSRASRAGLDPSSLSA
jgi:putative transposase